MAGALSTSMAILFVPGILLAETFISFPMDNDPDWVTEGGWAFGQPLGGGSHNMDPTAGHTGTNVYGYNLAGDYSNNMSQHWLTTTALDCSMQENVVLRFQRWLGVEDYIFDHAEIQASTDGSNWNTVWSHADYALSDASWQEQSYDISAIADGQPTVYIRWGMGPTDGSVTYPGWNIDDVSLEGDAVDSLDISPVWGFASSGYVGGPFSPTQIVYTASNLSASNTIGWTTGHSENWLSVSPASGILAPAASSNITVTINSAALALAPGSYADNLLFTNQFSNVAVSRSVSLEVLARPGELHIADSIPPSNDRNLPYGDTIIGQSRTEQVILSNSDVSNTLVVAGIALRRASITTSNRATAGIDVLVLASSSDPSVLRSALASYPDIATADFFDGSAATPTLTQLAGYDAVAVLSNDPFQDPTATGDVLADYADTGGAVVQAESTFATDLGLGLGGRFASEGYSPFVSGPLLLDFFPWSLGAYAVGHPLMEGVFALSDYLIVDVSLRPDTEWVADWNDGTPLVAVSDKGIVGINLYAMDDGLYDGDVALLFRNALVETTAPGFALGALPSLPHHILPGSNLVFDIVYTPDNEGSHTATVLIDSNDNDEPEASIALSGNGLLDYLEVTPDDAFFTSGHPGGPFTPATHDYQLQNSSSNSVSWQASANEAWLSMSPSSGTLTTGESTSVTLSLSSAANTLPEGNYAAAITFSNLTTGVTQSRSTQLTVFTTPQIAVTPAEGFVVTNQPGHMQHRALIVSNALSADGNLDFSASTIETGRNETPAASQTEPAAPSSSGNESEIITGVEYKPGRLLVRFAPGLGIAAQHSKAAAVGGDIRKRFSLVPGLCLVQLGRGADVMRAIQGLSRAPDVIYAQPDFLWHADTIPNDTSMNALWGMNNTGQNGGTPDADIDAPEAWNVAIGNHGIVVAVIDTGVDYTHPDLDDNMWTNPGEIPGNGLDDDGNGFVDDVHGYDFVNNDGDPMDDHHHGTHCAGTVGAEGNNDEGVVGVCWNVRIMALKFLDATGYGSTADAISCIEYAKQMGAKVTSNSWSGDPYDQALKDAIDAAGTLGITFVAAAGNDSQDNDSTPAYPSSFVSDNIIAVVSSDRNDARSSFSNYGAISTDLAAPGSSIYSCVPGGSYQYLSGTSMAAPHVAGACALLLSIDPSLSAEAIRQILMDTVDSTLPGICASGGRLNLAHAAAVTRASWVQASPPYTNNVTPGTSVNVTVNVDATDLGPGSYTGAVVIASNDPDTPNITVPVIMVVEDPDPLDLDGDGIADWWESLYFGAPSNCIWYSDDDGDEYNNREEFIAFTDPTNEASFFAVTGHGISAESNYFVVDWLSVTGRYYDVSWSTNLQQGFELLESNLEHPQSSYTDVLHGAESEGFYNIEVRLNTLLH